MQPYTLRVKITVHEDADPRRLYRLLRRLSRQHKNRPRSGWVPSPGGAARSRARARRRAGVQPL